MWALCLNRTRRAQFAVEEAIFAVRAAAASGVPTSDASLVARLRKYPLVNSVAAATNLVPTFANLFFYCAMMSHFVMCLNQVGRLALAHAVFDGRA